VQTEWLAYLDDDDMLGPVHLERLMDHAEKTNADLVFPWFTVVGSGSDPFPANEHREWDAENPHHTTVTFLVRTEVARKVGFFIDSDLYTPEEFLDGPPGQKQGEEFRFVLRVAAEGYKIEKLHERTWFWRHHRTNTSGQPPA
jgi:hypothetical protein